MINIIKKWFQLLILISILSTLVCAQTKVVYENGYIVKVGQKAPGFIIKEAGVTGNVIIDRSGKIIFLTRLFERKEFDKMKEVIFTELAKK
jgi:hypothetical protein